jgi:hypothetical protein
MPVDKLLTLASVIVAGIMVAHPFTWKLELRKLEYRMLREATDTRSWGNPSIFQYGSPISEQRRVHHAKK